MSVDATQPPGAPRGRGRPRLSSTAWEARVAAYCTRYGVGPADTGLPPFPRGQRETRQHREWMALYKAHQRLLSPGSGGLGSQARDCIQAQAGRCPVCAERLDPAECVEDRLDDGRWRGVLDRRCHRAVVATTGLKAEGLDRLRDYLWPSGSPSKRRG